MIRTSIISKSVIFIGTLKLYFVKGYTKEYTFQFSRKLTHFRNIVTKIVLVFIKTVIVFFFLKKTVNVLIKAIFIICRLWFYCLKKKY